MEKLENWMNNILLVAHLKCKNFIKRKDNLNPEKKGGYLTIVDKKTAEIILIYKVGRIAPEKVAKYFKISQQKADQLYLNPDLVSSWQMRDPEKGWYGGAISTEKLIFSFSGLSEHGDEYVVTSIALMFEMLDLGQARNIFMISKNPYAKKDS